MGARAGFSSDPGHHTRVRHATAAASSAAGRRGRALMAPKYGVSVVDQGNGEMPAVQAMGGLRGSDIHRIAEGGTRGAQRALPFLETIQKSFGPGHSLDGISAYADSTASDACRKMGAMAYTVGDRIAFLRAPDLHTAAHEAAHVVQQRQGVSCKGGVGQAGDRYEEQADDVADAVVQGRSAEGLLAGMAGAASFSRGSEVVQAKTAVGNVTIDGGAPIAVYSRTLKEWCEFLETDADEEDGSAELTAFLRAVDGRTSDSYVTEHAGGGRAAMMHRSTHHVALNFRVSRQEATTLLHALMTSTESDVPNVKSWIRLFGGGDNAHDYALAQIWDGFTTLNKACGADVLRRSMADNSEVDEYEGFKHYSDELNTLSNTGRADKPQNELITVGHAVAIRAAIELFYYEHMGAHEKSASALEAELSRAAKLMAAMIDSLAEASEREMEAIKSLYELTVGPLVTLTGAIPGAGAIVGGFAGEFLKTAGGKLLDSLLGPLDAGEKKRGYKHQFELALDKERVLLVRHLAVGGRSERDVDLEPTLRAMNIKNAFFSKVAW